MTRTTHLAVSALVLSLLVDARDGRAHVGASRGAGGTDLSEKGGGHLGAESTLRDVLRHPSFAGFSRLLLPWDDRAYDEQMPLTGTSAEGWVWGAIRFWETSLRGPSTAPK